MLDDHEYDVYTTIQLSDNVFGFVSDKDIIFVIRATGVVCGRFSSKLPIYGVEQVEYSGKKALLVLNRHIVRCCTYQLLEVTLDTVVQPTLLVHEEFSFELYKEVNRIPICVKACPGYP